MDKTVEQKLSQVEKPLKPEYAKYKVESNLKKYKDLNGYTCNSKSIGSLIRHLGFKFEFSEFELVEAHKKNKITIYYIMEETE